VQPDRRAGAAPGPGRTRRLGAERARRLLRHVRPAPRPPPPGRAPAGDRCGTRGTSGRVIVDLNVDIGELPGAEAARVDAQLLEHVTSANVACGGHAGDD